MTNLHSVALRAVSDTSSASISEALERAAQPRWSVQWRRELSRYLVKRHGSGVYVLVNGPTISTEDDLAEMAKVADLVAAALNERER